MSTSILHIHTLDSAAVALRPLHEGESVEFGTSLLHILNDIPAGHKVAIKNLKQGERVIKYGHFIGVLTQDVEAGAWVHSHNLKTGLEGILEYRYTPIPAPLPQELPLPRTFRGYKRANGKVGTRNEIWIVNTVGCVNISAERIAKIARERFAQSAIDGVFSYSHPYGCSQLGDDLNHTQRVLAGLMRHPNAGGVLVLGLGCENNRMEQLLQAAGDIDRSRIRFFNSQDVQDEVEEGVNAIAELIKIAEQDKRTECPVSDLVLGMKCGGSDGFSGITANPLVGRMTDIITAYDGTAVLTEVPEMFGAEQQLMNRAADGRVFQDVVTMINDFKSYFTSHNMPIYENPSPGNIEGGITTLEEKSLGATQKGGSATVTQVLNYGEPVKKRGLALLKAPGNDAVSTTAEVASGATMILFTTGRGTPLGLPVPTVKIASNNSIFQRKPQWIDFSTGGLLDGTATKERLTRDLWTLIVKVASGEIKTKNEVNGYKEIAIWKEGVTL